MENEKNLFTNEMIKLLYKDYTEKTKKDFSKTEQPFLEKLPYELYDSYDKIKLLFDNETNSAFKSGFEYGVKFICEILYTK